MYTNDTAIAITVDSTEEQEKKSCLPVVEFRLITIDASHYHSYEYTVINWNCNTPGKWKYLNIKLQLQRIISPCYLVCQHKQS